MLRPPHQECVCMGLADQRFLHIPEEGKGEAKWVQAAQRKAQEEAEARRKAEEDRKTALRAQQLKACHSPPLDLNIGVPGWLEHSLLWCMWLRGMPGWAQLLVCGRPMARRVCSKWFHTQSVMHPH